MLAFERETTDKENVTQKCHTSSTDDDGLEYNLFLKFLKLKCWFPVDL